MDSAKIKSFLFLSEFLSYTKAGDALNISQSVLSRHIKSLEEELGFELFNRNSKNVSSPPRLLMAEGLRDLNNRYDILVERASLARDGYTGEIRIGIMDGLLLSGFRQIKLEYETPPSRYKIRFHL
jgi:DNA-binding transcriptional LysR family regulator